MARGKLSRSASVIALAAVLAGGCTLKTERPTADRSVTPVAASPLEVSAPDWRVGDQWTYSDGYGLTVMQAENGLTVFQRTDEPEQWFSRKGFLRQDAQSATTLRSVVYRSIPVTQAAVLQGGDPLVFTREFTTKGATLVHSTSWVVEGRDTISVPAGDFDCYVMVMRTRNAETGWTGFERWWYAPKVRHYVRMEYRYGDKPVASRVLTQYTPNGAYVAGAPVPAVEQVKLTNVRPPLTQDGAKFGAYPTPPPLAVFQPLPVLNAPIVPHLPPPNVADHNGNRFALEYSAAPPVFTASAEP